MTSLQSVFNSASSPQRPAFNHPPQDPDDPNVAISIRRLRKVYGAIEAVRGIDFDVRPGEIFGLIGPDGAGKTSVFQILGGVMPATSGEAIMLGRPARDARSYVGYLTQVFSLYHDLTVSENLRYIGELRRLSNAQIAERSLRYLRMFGMDQFTDRLAGKLSGGMKQKLSLACALIIEPKILLLDEPTTGVDPVSRREFWDALADLSSQGITIVIATPYLDEAERCTRIGFMHEGLIHQTGTPRELRDHVGLQRLIVRAADLSRAEDLLDETKGVDDAQRFGDHLDVMVKNTSAGEKLTRETLRSAGIRIDEIKVASPTLENSFVAMLRHVEDEVRTTPFPVKRKFKDRPTSVVAIGARDLSKTFGDFEAVKRISLEVKYGEIYGLLGANGAGKTTTIKMLCGLLEATEGEAELAGETGSLRSSDVRQRVGYMSQKFSLYDDLTIEENLDFFAGVYRVPLAERAEKRRWVLSFSGLQGREKQMTGSLPGGWKQRVAFGAAVMHEPSVLFLDEPTSGVDPLARRAFWKMINSFADRGMGILVTTHYLEEAEQCNRLGLMVAGELVAQGSPSDLKADQKAHVIEFVTDAAQRANNLLKQEVESWRVSLFGERLHVVVDEDPDSAIKQITEKLGREQINVSSAEVVPYSLEDVFIGLVEKMRRQGKQAEE
ncbi:MAG TPA: ATP-binding cassette domain-containing protein [Pyrinomonadaceae bacterium]|jgi:drug efflux transport system ATP-binding protein|nr:ATP-binding cassette domain-containing protein [Pyrinomonadaceae bacterium]